MKVGTVSTDPGEKATGKISVGETRDGTPIELPVAVVDGAAEGDRLYVQAVSDGDELNGLGVVSRLVPSLDPDRLRGSVVVVGIVNPHGFRQNASRNPIDGEKINRQYPGKDDGTASERIAHETFKIASGADLVIDFHQGVSWRMVNETRVRCGSDHRLYEECLELAEAFNTRFLYDRKGSEGQLARAAPDAGVPAIDPELGGSVGWNLKNVRVGLAGVRNVLRHYDFLDGNPDVQPSTTVRTLTRYSAPVGGLLEPRVAVGERVGRGEVLFEVTDVFGQPKATVTADEDGIAWAISRQPNVATGESAYVLGADIKNPSVTSQTTN